MATADKDDHDRYEEEEQSRTPTIVFAICLFLFILLFLFVYGFESQFYEDSLNKAKQNLPQLFMSSVFTLLGFGLLLSPFSRQRMGGITIALFVISFCWIVGPLLQQLWFTAFFTQFYDDDESLFTNAQEFWDKGTQENVQPSFSSFRLASLCSVSFLMGISGMSGRVTIGNLFQCLLVFNILWYLNINLNIQMSYANDPKSLTYMDDFGTYFVYLFGAVYGFVICAFNRKDPERRLRNYPDNISLVYYLMGSAFLFATFMFMGLHITEMEGTAANYKHNAGTANVFFTLTGSVVGTYIGSLFMNGGRIGIWEAGFGTVVGGTVIGAGAGFIENIGVCIFLGVLAGFLTSVLMTTVWPSLNKNGVFDSQGFIFPVLLATFIGGFVAFPCVIIRHYVLEANYSAIGDVKEEEWQAAGFQLAYFGVTLGIAVGSGLISGILHRIIADEHHDFTDTKLFSDDYGLFTK
jgi:hypothetical protein